MSTHQHHASELSPVMRAYARLVRAHHDWQMRDVANDVATRRILDRMDAAKRALDKECGGTMNQQYLRMWASAKAEGEALAREEIWEHATHPSA